MERMGMVGARSKRVVAAAMLVAAAWARAQVPAPDVLINGSGLHVVINLPQTRLFVYRDGTLLKSYPVAVGKMLTQTPTGTYAVTGIYPKPIWYVPKSIQEEMKQQGKPVLTSVPPGPDNPLGNAFVRFGDPRLGLGMHGTNVPTSVPGFRSHGCVRLKNEDIDELASTVSPGAAVTVAYQTVLLNEDAAGELWLTALKNPYKYDDPSFKQLAQVLLAWQSSRQVAVHGKRVDVALRERNGKPVCLSCKSADKARISGELSALRWLSGGSKAPELAPSETAPAAPEALPETVNKLEPRPAKKPAKV
nr:L,D-transpeptidase [uncultured Pseudogulbenkiania sp.]